MYGSCPPEVGSTARNTEMKTGFLPVRRGGDDEESDDTSDEGPLPLKTKRGSLWARIERHSFPEAPSITLPRAVSVAAFRMRTGHDYLAAPLHRINALPSPECQLCGYGTINAKHLRTCSDLDHSKNYQNGIFKETISTGQRVT
ncbi:hypothetical protein TNCT_482611 [Trichonephila clavata]|uniref:Uncharacterized protein n=1 Tax=Trichonephila clavata TaxID=2740835 RepID=A0A8X6J929_TRICU|nr:hypothetical protein TNCT_482611 [Trichonephila clavata]